MEAGRLLMMDNASATTAAIILQSFKFIHSVQCHFMFSELSAAPRSIIQEVISTDRVY